MFSFYYFNAIIKSLDQQNCLNNFDFLNPFNWFSEISMDNHNALWNENTKKHTLLIICNYSNII